MKSNWFETLQTCYQLFPIEPQGNDAIPVLLAFRKGVITQHEFDDLKFNCFGAAYFTEKTKWS